jgi:hypothetical protein
MAAVEARPKRQTAAQLIAEARSELARGPRGGASKLHAAISRDVSLGSTDVFLQKNTDRLLQHTPQPRLAPRYARAYTSEKFRRSLQGDAIASESQVPEPEPEPESPARPRSLEPLLTAGLWRFDLPAPDATLVRLYKRPLERLDPHQVYPQYNGGWACDGCGAYHGAEMYHCAATSYDLCAACVQEGLGYSFDGPVDDEALPRLPSRGLAIGAALGDTFRSHDPQLQASTQKRGAGSPVGQRALRNPDAALELELSRQEFFAIYRQHTSDEVRAVASTTAKAAETADDVVPNSTDTIEKKLTRLYRSIDTDFSNSVDAKELWEGLSRIGLGLSRESVKKMAQQADADGDGSLDLQEFLAAFTESFLGNDMARGIHETQWAPTTLVRLDPLLARLTKVTERGYDSEEPGRFIMQRSEITDMIWVYVESEFLGERSGRTDSMIDLDKNLAAVFGVPEVDGDAGGNKKKKKKDGELPQIPKWQFAAMMDSTVDALLTPVFRKRTVATPGSDAPIESTGSEEDVLPNGVDLQQAVDAGSASDRWALFGLELDAKGCAPVGDTASKRDSDLGAQDENDVASPRSLSDADAIPSGQLRRPTLLQQNLDAATQYLAFDIQSHPQQRPLNAGPDVVVAPVEAITPRSAFLAATQQQQLLPVPLPLIITSGADDDSGSIVELCGHSLGQRYTSALATSLKRFSPSFMSAFGLRNGGLDDTKGAQLVRAIAHQKELTSLDLSRNLFSKATVKELEALLVPPLMKVSSLNLSCNRLGDAGMQMLALAMTSGTSWSSEEGKRHYPNKTVRRLDVSSNGIGFLGASALATVLNLNSTLTELVVGSNTIGAPGCIKIAEALEGNGATNLRMLNFSHCQILDVGAQALLQAMQENDALRNQLEMLDVSHNLLSRETMSSLVDLLGDKVTVNEILQASEKRNANSMFRQAQSVTDHRAQEHEALSTAIARAAEVAVAEAAATALAAKEAAAAQAASVTNSAFVPGSWRLHYPMPEHKPAGWAAHYPVSTGVSTTL